MSQILATLPAGQKNGPKEIMAYFSVPTKGEAAGYPADGKVTLPEFSDFWKSLSEEDKDALRFANLAAL